MRLRSIIFLGLFLLGGGAGLYVDGQTTGRKALPATGEEPSFTRITQQELAMLLADVGAANPALLKDLAEDPELRQAQLNNLKQLLAFARQAQKDGLAAVPLHARELRHIRDETIAVNYDRHLNRGKDETVPFARTPDARVQAYWGETPGRRLAASVKSARSAGYQEFFDTKVALLKAANPEMADKVITEEEKIEARELYAKIRIYADEYAKRSPLLPKSLHDRVKLQVKLKQAQFLARLYSEKIAERTQVSDEEIANFIKEHPEHDIAAKRTKASEILGRAKGGEDFATLANEFSEDPGNTSPQGEPQGGLYKDVSIGTMVPSFEKAALALEAGQISPELVESDFGFHIVKLERKGKSPGVDTSDTYDVRHILIATGIHGADGRLVSVKEYVKSALEREIEDRIIDEVVTANNITVPADFTVPTVPAKAESPKTAKPSKARKVSPGSTRKRN